MAVTDIASRTYNHGWRLDPIVRSLLDTDFYKLLMLQMIREFYPNQRTTFSVINRSKHVRLAEVLDEGASYERQRALVASGGRLEDVVDALVTEFAEDRFVKPGEAAHART